MSDVMEKEVVDGATAEKVGETLTQEKVNQMIEEMGKKNQAEIDRRVSKFVSENAELRKALDEEKKKSLSAKEYEEMQREELAKQLSEKEQTLKMQELVFHKTKMLSEKNFDLDLIDVVSGSSVEEFSLNVEKVQKKIKEIVEKEINARLKGASVTPQVGQGDEGLYTMDEMVKMTAREINKDYEKFRRSQEYYRLRGNK